MLTVWLRGEKSMKKKNIVIIVAVILVVAIVGVVIFVSKFADKVQKSIKHKKLIIPKIPDTIGLMRTSCLL